MKVIPEVGPDAEIYASHCDELTHFASAVVGPDDAADVLSTVVLRVLTRGSLANLEDPRSYLYRAVLNESRSVLRRRGRTRSLFADLVPRASQAPSVHPEVLEAVGKLPARQRAATYLVYWMGCSAPEAAHLMGARPGTIYRYLHLARRHLRRILDDHAF